MWSRRWQVFRIRYSSPINRFGPFKSWSLSTFYFQYVIFGRFFCLFNFYFRQLPLCKFHLFICSLNCPGDCCSFTLFVLVMRVGWTPLTSHLLPVLIQPVQHLTPSICCLCTPIPNPLHCPPTDRSGGRSCGSRVGTCCSHWYRSTSCSHSGSFRTPRQRRTPRRTRPHSIDDPRIPTGTASRRSTCPTRATRRRPTASSSCHSSARFTSSHSMLTCSLLFRVRLLSSILLFLSLV